MARATEQEVRNFEQGIRSQGAGRKPLSPAKRREMAERLRNYRVVANLCEQAVRELATANRLKAMQAVECRQYARKVLGRLWQNRAGPVPESRAEGSEPADERFAGLESGLRRLVEQAVAGQFRLLQDRVPELFST